MYEKFRDISFCLMSIQIPLIILKIRNYLSWSLWLVLIPFWLTQILFIVLLIVGFIRAYIQHKIAKKYFEKMPSICKLYGNSRYFQRDPIPNIVELMKNEPYIVPNEELLLTEKITVETGEGILYQDFRSYMRNFYAHSEFKTITCEPCEYVKDEVKKLNEKL